MGVALNITLTGATGFVGARLIPRLLNAGHSVHMLGRRRPASLPAQARFSAWRSEEGAPPPESLPGADPEIPLAGEPVARHWTPEVKDRIRASRVNGT